jgi:hypothetical protein
MNKTHPVVFIGSGEASVIERKTLIYSIRKHTAEPVEIIVFNGTHNSLERDGAPPELAPMPLKAKYQNITEFSNYRFLIPQLCGHQGKAIWLDSDMVCLRSVTELFETPLNGHDFLAKAEIDNRGRRRWGLSVALYDCSSCHFDLERYTDEIAQGLYSYNDMQQMREEFLRHHPMKIGELDPNWNCYDSYSADTKLIHYTNLHTQPWKVRGHRQGGLWFRYFEEARQAGFITDDDIELAKRRAYVRYDLTDGNTLSFGGILRNALVDAKASLYQSFGPRTSRG